MTLVCSQAKYSNCLNCGKYFIPFGRGSQKGYFLEGSKWAERWWGLAERGWDLGEGGWSLAERGWDLAERGWDLAERGWGLAERGWGLAERGWGLAEQWLMSSRVVRASGCQCQIRNCPWFDPSIHRHSGIWGEADEVVLNKYINSPLKNECGSWEENNLLRKTEQVCCLAPFPW